MARTSSCNPIAFTTWPVTLLLSVVYLLLLSALIYTHHVVPSAPSDKIPINGVNLTEAWLDLQHISTAFHPYNSLRNDDVRSWLLTRIKSILHENKIKYSIDANAAASNHTDISPVTVFDDNISNSTFFDNRGSLFVYFEGTNIIVYIRGSRDGEGDWWHPAGTPSQYHTRGVLVNAHYDSVSTGYGATDDGVGVISALQLVKYYTTSGNQPQRGIVVLLNNGEEDYLNGARVFPQHPISKFPSTFLNLEGAGAGGRASLFRSSDTAITKAYQNSPYPFGTVISGDGFNRGFIRSQTDYIVFHGRPETGGLGLRGLDVAFYEPRAKYHTAEDAARQTDRNSLWHMLSAALATTKSLANDADQEDDGSVRTSDAVWFDLFGRTFALLELNGLFAISVVLLVVPPLVLIVVGLVLVKQDKSYLFAIKTRNELTEDASRRETGSVRFYGWHGVFRQPIAITLASAAVIGLAFLQAKLNPYMVYSSQYAVWSMMLTAGYFVAWFILTGSDSIRPSALHRTYAFLWFFIGGWFLLVAATIAERNYSIAGVYFIVIPFAAVFLCLLVSMLELLGLPKRSDYARSIGSLISAGNASHARLRRSSSASDRTATRSTEAISARTESRDHEDAEATETTSLLSSNRNLTFSGYRRRMNEHDEDTDDEGLPRMTLKEPYGDEQLWSGLLPSWTWALQFLLLAPIIVILVGQVALLLISALRQTLADGSPVIFIYLCMAVLSMFLLIPVLPFVHRVTFYVPLLLFLVLIATTIYNLVAFPFSEQNRLKVFFAQQIDLDSGANRVLLAGLDGYVQQIITSLPSSSGQAIDCSIPTIAKYNGLVTCGWHGLRPRVVHLPELEMGEANDESVIDMKKSYRSWLSFNITTVKNISNEAVIEVSGQDTRSCRLMFDTAISSFAVEGSSVDRLQQVSPPAPVQVRLWHREWNKSWRIRFRWEESKHGKDVKPRGKIVCLWNDQTQIGVIPALDEVKGFMPTWSIVTKMDDGLVEGSKKFSL